MLWLNVQRVTDCFKGTAVLDSGLQKEGKKGIVFQSKAMLTWPGRGAITVTGASAAAEGVGGQKPKPFQPGPG